MDSNMTKGLKITALGLALTFGAVSAQAMVTISDADDGNDDASLFDSSAAGFTQSGTFGEVITLNLNSFEADGTDLTKLVAADSISMTLTAPAGYKITSISYTEGGNGETGSSGFATATGSITLDGDTRNFLTQLFTPNTNNTGWTITPLAFTGLNQTAVELNIDNVLNAFEFGGTGVAFVEKTLAEINVGLTAIPLPPAIFMLGAAIAGLATVGRRKNA